MRYYIHPQTGEFLCRCPQCGATLRFDNPLEVEGLQRAGACGGCRAQASFERNPALIGLFVVIWSQSKAWPQSNSWMNAIPPAGISLLANACQTQGPLPGWLQHMEQSVLS